MEPEKNMLPGNVREEVDEFINEVFKFISESEDNLEIAKAKYLFVKDVLRCFKLCKDTKDALNGERIVVVNGERIDYKEHFSFDGKSFKIKTPNNESIVITHMKHPQLVLEEYGVIELGEHYYRDNSGKLYFKCYNRIIKIEEAKKFIEYLYLLLKYPELIVVPFSVKFGGFIMSRSNLSRDGECFVEDDSIVCGEAKVMSNAIVRDGALVYGNAEIGGYAVVSGKSTRLYGDVKVFGYARLNDARLEGICKIGGDTRISATVPYPKNCLNYRRTIPQIMRQAVKTGNYNCTIIDRIRAKDHRIQMVDGTIGGDLYTEFASKYYELNDNHKRSILSKIFRSRLETVEERLKRAFKEGCQANIINDETYQIFDDSQYYGDYAALNEFEKFLSYLHRNPQFYQLNEKGFKVFVESYFDKRLEEARANCSQRAQLVNDFLPVVESELYCNIIRCIEPNFTDSHSQEEQSEVVTSVSRTFSQQLINTKLLLNHLGKRTYGSIDPVAEYTKFVNLLIEEKGVRIFYRDLSKAELIAFKNDYIARLNEIDLTKQRNFQTHLQEKYFNLNFINSFESSIGKPCQIIFRENTDYGRYDILDEYINFVDILEKSYGPNFTNQQLQVFTNIYEKVIAGEDLDNTEANFAKLFSIKTSVISLDQKKAILADIKERYFDEPMMRILDGTFSIGNSSVANIIAYRAKMFNAENIFKEVESFVKKVKEKYGENPGINEEELSNFADNYIKDRFETEYYKKIGIENIWSFGGLEQYFIFILGIIPHGVLKKEEFIEKLKEGNNGSSRNIESFIQQYFRYLERNQNNPNADFNAFKWIIDVIADDNTAFISYLKKKYLNLEFLKKTGWDLKTIKNMVEKQEVRTYTVNDISLELEKNVFEIEEIYKEELAPSNQQLTPCFAIEHIDKKINAMDVNVDWQNLKQLVTDLKNKYLNPKFIRNFRQFQSILRQLSNAQIIVKPCENKIDYFKTIDADCIEIYSANGVFFRRLLPKNPKSFPKGHINIMGPTIISCKNQKQYVENYGLIVDYGTTGGRYKHVAFKDYDSIVKRELSRFTKLGATGEGTDTRKILENILLKRDVEIEIPNILQLKHEELNAVTHDIMDNSESDDDFEYKERRLKFEIKFLENMLEIKKRLLMVKNEISKLKAKKKNMEEERDRIIERIKQFKKVKRDNHFVDNLTKKRESSNNLSQKNGRGMGD